MHLKGTCQGRVRSTLHCEGVQRSGGPVDLRLPPVMEQLRGRLDDAEGWYRRSLEIAGDFGDRPGRAGSYHQIEEERRLPRDALTLFVRVLGICLSGPWSERRVPWSSGPSAGSPPPWAARTSRSSGKKVTDGAAVPDGLLPPEDGGAEETDEDPAPDEGPGPPPEED